MKKMSRCRKYFLAIALCLIGLLMAAPSKTANAAPVMAKPVLLADSLLVDSSRVAQGKWIKKGKNVYFQQKDGSFLKGWLTWKGYKYYLSRKNGARVTGWRNIDGKRYFFRLKNGRLATGWFSYHGKKYFATSKGVLKKGWLNYKGNWYFLSRAQKGAMRTGWVTIKGRRYFFYSNGKMAVKTWVDDDHYVDKNGILDAKAVQKRKDTFRWPLARKWNTISSPFGNRGPMPVGTSDHNGIDIPAAMNTPVHAARAGTVVACEYNDSAGNFIEIRHGNGLASQYMHMTAFKSGIKVGSRVHRGQVIGYVGSTGWSTGAHLHFGVKVKGKYYADPLKYVRQP